MRIIRHCAIAAASAFAFHAAASQLPPQTPLVEDGPVRVEAIDLEAYMLRVPENRRAEVRSSHERVATMVDSMFVARSLAERARRAGLDKDPAVQRRMVQVQEALLADLYIQHLDKRVAEIDLEARARELYLAEPARFTGAEQVHIQHLLVGLNGRTVEMARERAEKIHREATSGAEEFLALAARYSDDPDKKRNGGELGYNSPNAFVEPLAERLKTMTREGEISEPIESHMGFHIVRFVDRIQPRLAKFEEVKKDIIAVEKERLAKKRHEDLLQEIRGSSTVTVHRDNVEALVTPLDDVLPKAAAAASGAQPAR